MKSVLCFLPLTMIVLASAVAEPVPCTFVCSFENDTTPSHARGSAMAMPGATQFVPGKTGMGTAVDSPDQACHFMAGPNLPKDRGSIEFWLQPRWEDGDRKRHGFVCDEGGRAKAGINTIWIWKIGSSLRFDVRDPHDSYITANISTWKRGEWYHVLANWDYEKGTSLYIDGKLAGERECSWIPRSQLRFSVGKRQQNSEAAEAVIDELRIYARPLTPDEAALAAAGKLESIPATRTVVPRETAASATRSPKLLFHLPFDGSSTAAVANGNGLPDMESDLLFSDGLIGKAARFTGDTRLRYHTPGNIDKEEGTISFWYKPLAPFTVAPGAPPGDQWRCCFVEAPRPEQRKGSNMMWLWFWGNRLRFDVSNPADTYARQGLGSWADLRWRHIAATWDCRVGTKIYVDGEAVGVGSDGHSALLTTSWKTFDTFPFFHIGSGQDGQSANGAIDDFRIYDMPLGPEDIRKIYCQVYKLEAEFCQSGPPYVRVGQQAELAWQLKTQLGMAFEGKVSWQILDPDDTELLPPHQEKVNLAAGSPPRVVTQHVTSVVPGRHCIHISWEEAGQEQKTNLEFYAIPPEPTETRPSRLQTRLLDQIDLTQPLAGRQVACTGESHIVKAGLGTYLELDEKQRTRMAIQIDVPEADAPYVLEVDYPDDKPRTMEIMAQTTVGQGQEYELQTGVYCGDEYPLSNCMLTHRCVFWARSTKMAVLLMTAEKGRPAAAAQIRLSALTGRLPDNIRKPTLSGETIRRHVGIYYEDPALCYDFGGHASMPEFGKTISRLMDYMEWSGQDLFMYPGVWYHGPLYPSRSQRLAMSRTHPDNFIEYILTRFDDRGLSFIPTLNVHDLSTLTKYKCTEELILSGKLPASPLMIYDDGMPNMGGWHGTPPNYNPIHPEVREAILKMIAEMAELYGQHPSFKGVCFHLPRHVMLWFGHASAGYNDYCIDPFTKETGIHIPIADDDPSRASKRAAWLKANAWDTWIAWRCKAIHALYTDVATILTDARPDLKLIVNLYRPSIRDNWEDEDYMEPGYVLKVNREGGVDPGLYKDDPSIIIQQTIYPADYRWCRARNRGIQREKQRQRHFNRESFTTLCSSGLGWINMHDRYWEDAIGRTDPIEADWLKEIGWRVSTLNPTPPQFLQHYLAPLRFTDVQTFTKGGFLIGTHGVESQLAEFANVFRALPTIPFTDVPGSHAPVTVIRFARRENQFFFYVANTTATTSTTTIRLQGKIDRIRELPTGNSLQTGPENSLTIETPPYSLKAFTADGKNITVATAVLSP